MRQTARVYPQIRFVSYLFPKVGVEWFDSRGEEIKLVIEKVERYGNGD